MLAYYFRVIKSILVGRYANMQGRCVADHIYLHSGNRMENGVRLKAQSHTLCHFLQKGLCLLRFKYLSSCHDELNLNHENKCFLPSIAVIRIIYHRNR